MTTKVFIEEFTFRGRPPGDPTPAAWHLVLGAAQDDGFGGEAIILKGPLTPAEADAAGFTLDAVCAQIDAAALKAADDARAAMSALHEQISSLEQNVAELQATLAAARFASPVSTGKVDPLNQGE